MSTGTSIDATDTADLQAQVVKLMTELDAANLRIIQLQASPPQPPAVNNIIASYQANMQAIAQQGLAGVEAVNQELLRKLGATLPTLGFSSDEQIVIIAMRTNESFHIATVASAKTLLGQH